MKKSGYYFIKNLISLGLSFYYKSIEVKGLENIPQNKPVVFLSNHQNALLDVLLIATRCSRKPWFLARADVFKIALLRPLFQFLQMLPIYRLRDGKTSLAKNHAIFDKCSDLLNKQEAILIFPEANHNLKRRIRSLSKGFTRILFNVLEQHSKSDIILIPIGQNYQNPTDFGDSAILYFGKAIRVQDFISDNKNQSIQNLKSEVSKGLKQLTTHIENEEDYKVVIEQLDSNEVDYLRPKTINSYLINEKAEINTLPKQKNTLLSKIFRILFYLNNIPFVLIWRVLLKPKVPEAEFMSTFRFGFSMIIYPVFYLLFLLFLGAFIPIKTACLLVIGHAVLNLFLIKNPLQRNE